MVRYGRRLLFRCLRYAGGRTTPRLFINQFFSHMSFLLPVERLHETATLVAFYHPQPAYPLHILLVPKRPLASLDNLTPADTDFLTDLFATVQYLVEQLDLRSSGYRLVVNGGAYQELPHLHFHLISDSKSEFTKKMLTQRREAAKTPV